VGIGLAVALTPTVGVQMFIVAALALIPGLKFNVPIGVAMVWVSNPFTMVPFYYAMYWVGLRILGREGSDFLAFEAVFTRFVDSLSQETNFFVSFWDGLVGLFDLGVEIAYPMWVGGIIIAVSCSIPSYFLTLFLLGRARSKATSSRSV
jgi:uncharacterized protein (DUF2062 family)